MGKVDENKHQKMDALFQSAYDLFLNQGIEKTSISDIAKKAGVAKGTFYLYFADKYEIRDRLIARTASRLFQRAHKALETADIPEFEDKIIFIVDYVLNAMQKNKLILRFISKNLSWGIFRQAITNNMQDDEGEILAYFSNILLDHPTIKLRAPETMRADGVILSSDGWGNSDVDFANTAEQMEIRGIPVTGLKFSGTVGQFVVENDHLGEILDINKSEEGIETDVLGENNVTELDAKKVTAMLKLKMRKNEKR